jgi:HEAT repeat protein
MVRRIEEEIARLGQLRQGDPAAAAAPLKKALGDRVNLVAAKAAEVAASLRMAELVPELLRAFHRLFENPVKSDPQCWGKNAVARALKDLEYDTAAPFLRGAAHVQMEPVWGGTADTAGTLRGICLLALPGCSDIGRDEIMRHLVKALTEEDAAVRSDAARAFGGMGGNDSGLVLRLKARVGDTEPAVTGQVLESLLIVERAQAVPFVKELLVAEGGVTAEEAALALGNSKLEAAVDALLEAWAQAAGEGYRETLLRALSLSRDDRAVAFLKELAAEGRESDRAAAKAALALFGGREKQERV